MPKHHPGFIVSSSTRTGSPSAGRLQAHVARTLDLCFDPRSAERGSTGEMPASTGVFRDARADRGAWTNAVTLSRWCSVVRAGRLREIHERFIARGSIRSVRVFEYDTAGVLRPMTEQTWRVGSRDDAVADDALPDDSVPPRKSLVEFQQQRAVLAVRRFREMLERH